MSIEVKLNEVVISYPSLFVARSFNNGKPKYFADFVLDKDKHQKEIEQIKNSIQELSSKVKGKLSKICLRDGDEPKHWKDEILKEEYKNSYVLKSSTADRPIVVGKNGKTQLGESDGVFRVGGDIVLSYVDLYFWQNDIGSGVSAELRGVQFLKEGEPLGGNTFNPDGKFVDMTEDEVINVFG